MITQAQIEAAAKAFHEQACDVSGDEPCAFCLDGAKAALTAAAEAGEQEWQRGYEAEMKSAAPAIAVLKQDVANTIERCAQVVRELMEEDHGNNVLYEKIISDIRALKEDH